MLASFMPNYRCGRNSGGFTYVGLLILVSVIGVASAATCGLGAVVQRREAEEELVRIGAEFQAALISYASATPAGNQPAPHTLQDLLRDPRHSEARRHLRKLYADPITGKEEWGLIEVTDGTGIIGVYSLSDAKPIKQSNFNRAFEHFEGAKSYRDWTFIAR
jgi:type II secretory pathway pseudopilin PulG